MSSVGLYAEDYVGKILKGSEGDIETDEQGLRGEINKCEMYK